MTETDDISGVKTGVPEITEELAQQVGEESPEVRAVYAEFYNWMRSKGKHHRQQKGLAKATAENYVDRLDQIHREMLTLFEVDDRVMISAEDADEFLLLLARDTVTRRDGEPFAESAKRKLSNALRKYFEWRYYEKDLDFEWKPSINFSDGNHTNAAEFTYEEIGRIFEVAKSYGKLPSYYEISSEERDGINGLIAQRLGKPKEKVNREDWQKADQSSKIWSLTSAGYDAGLTPIEVSRATIDWYKPREQILKIPSESASKEREKEVVSLSDDSDEAMSKWIRERRQLEVYDGTNKLWLNREGNPYQSGSLCSLLRSLCDEAEIPTKDRPIRWYSLRHSVGRHMKSDGSLSQTNDQLRHQTYETTETTYGNSAPEERRETLNKSRSKAKRAANDPSYEPYSGVDMKTHYGEARENVPDDALTSSSEGLHIDAHVKDTSKNRMQLSRQLLSDTDSSTSS